MRTRSWGGACVVLALASGCGGEPAESPASPAQGDAGGGDAAVAADAGGAKDSASPDDAGTAADADESGDADAAGDVIFPGAAWPTGEPADYGIDPTGLDLAAAAAEKNDSYCLLVIRHGVLVSERYWQGHDANTHERSFSIAKSYSSALVGIAIARGDISSLDASVADYLPEWKGSDREAITFRHLLSMTSGLQWSAFDDYFVMATLAQDHTQHAIALPLDKTPGTEWTYDNAAVQILEPVFRNATGMTIEQYAELHLWSKLGIQAEWAHDGAGHPTAYASVMASCRDQARFGYLYLHGGRWGSEQVVPAEFVQASLTPSQSQNRAYGYLWWLNSETPALDAMKTAWPGRMVAFAPPDHFAARGFGNQFIDVFPSRDLIVVRFGPDPLGTFDLAALTTDQHFAKHDEILAPVLGAVGD